MKEAKSSLSSFSSRILSWLYPQKCPVCRSVAEEVPCKRCCQTLLRETFRYQSPVPMVDELWAFYPYEGVASEFVKALKYRRETALTKFMAAEMRDLYEKWDPDVDFVVPVPIHPMRKSDRGFNQSDSLCEMLPSDVANKQLMRIRNTKPQVELTPEQRAMNLSGAFKCSESLVGKRILLVDDVFTTGATARECATALKEAGASWVGVMVFAVKRR